MSPYGAEALARSFRTVRMNTLEAAKSIPADQYVYTPVEGWRSVEKLLTHIALVYRFQHRMHGVEKRADFEGLDFPTLMAEYAAEEAVARTKGEVVALLEKEGATCAAWLETLSDDFLAEEFHFPPELEPRTKTRMEMILSIKEHEMHHRGQLMLIQRMLGIVPHLTRHREERTAAARET